MSPASLWRSAGAIGSGEDLPPSLFSLSMERCQPQHTLLSSDHGNGACGRNLNPTAHAGRPAILYPSPKIRLVTSIWSFVCFGLAAQWEDFNCLPIKSNRPSMWSNICYNVSSICLCKCWRFIWGLHQCWSITDAERMLISNTCWIIMWHEAAKTAEIIRFSGWDLWIRNNMDRFLFLPRLQPTLLHCTSTSKLPWRIPWSC